MAAALLKSGATMTMGPSTMSLSSPPCALSSKPSLQLRRGPIDARQSSGNNASSSSGSWSTAATMTTATTTTMTSRSSSRSSGSKGLRMRTRTAAGVRLAGSGSSAPAHVLTNADLSQLVETNDEWIAQRTGIRCVFFYYFFFGFFWSFIDHQPIERPRFEAKRKRREQTQMKASYSCAPLSLRYLSPFEVFDANDCNCWVGKGEKEWEREKEIERDRQGRGKETWLEISPRVFFCSLSFLFPQPQPLVFALLCFALLCFAFSLLLTASFSGPVCHRHRRQFCYEPLAIKALTFLSFFLHY